MLLNIFPERAVRTVVSHEKAFVKYILQLQVFSYRGVLLLPFLKGWRHFDGVSLFIQPTMEQLSSRSFRGFLVGLLAILFFEFSVVEAAVDSSGAGKVKNPKNPVGKHHHPSNSDFVVKYSDGTPFSAELEYQYLLPEQTVFDSTDEPVASKVLLTSPPRLTIQPSHVEDQNYRGSSFVNKQYGHHASNGASMSVSHSLKPEACVSETPTFPFVASSFPTELRTGVQYTITAGRIETASSTDLMNDIPEYIENKMSQPSTVLLQGTTVSTKSISEVQKR